MSHGFPPPSGEQFEIALDDQRATIVEVGGGIRAYDEGERPVLDPYPREAICDGAHGTPLVPWPNRLADGRYQFEGQELQLDLSELATHNAIHGLLRWRSWRFLDGAAGRVRMGTTLFPTPGYPFTLAASIEYSLSPAEGLRVATTLRNIGAGPAPVAAGQHPYLSPGREARVDEATLELRAATRILTDDERQLPTGSEPVAGTEFDLRSPRRIGELKIDYPFTDLERDGDGRAWTRLTGPDGRTVELWVDSAYPIIELYTGDTLAPPRRRLGLGCEPMSAPPNALASGEGLVRLEPGEAWRGEWGVRLR